MRYVVWTLRLLIFVAVLLFAYQNVTPVDVLFYGGARLTDVPLVVVLLVTFVLGAIFGAILMIPGRWRRWREAGRLRKDLSRADARDRKSVREAAKQAKVDPADTAVTPL